MAFWSAQDRATTLHDHLQAPDRADAWEEPEREPRGWKTLVLIVGLAALAWGAGYVGMFAPIQANMGGLPLVQLLIIGFSVALLMTVMVRHRPGARTADRAEEAARRPPQAISLRKGARPDFRRRFGSYASHAQVELADDSPADDGAPIADEPADILVPFPGNRAAGPTRGMQALAERLAAALAAADQEAAPEPLIDAALTRETATFSVPVNQTSLPKALAELTEQVSASDDGAYAERPQLELALPAPQSPASMSDVEDRTDVEEAAQFEPPLVLRRMAE